MHKEILRRLTAGRAALELIKGIPLQIPVGVYFNFYLITVQSGSYPAIDKMYFRRPPDSQLKFVPPPQCMYTFIQILVYIISYNHMQLDSWDHFLLKKLVSAATITVMPEVPNSHCHDYRN